MGMTWYHEQVLAMNDRYFPKPDVIHRLIGAKSLMDHHCFGELPVNAIAGLSLISQFHFIRLFKRCYGMTPYQYLTEKRVQRAKKLLGANVSVMDTCFELGFDSPASFSSFFKKHTGANPSVYRRKSNPSLSPASSCD